MRNFRTKILVCAAVVIATPTVASQPIWQPAIYCAALDFTRAALLEEAEGPLPDWVGTAETADLSGRAYLRIATEALDCPDPDLLRGYLANARLGIAYRMEIAAGYGIDPAVMVLPIASEAELVCEINFDPDLLAAARAAVIEPQPAPPCADTD